MILCGDIGGTKSLLGLAEDGRLVIDRRYANADFNGFDTLLSTFLAEAGGPPVEAACLALAGPIADDGCSARLTNLPWTIAADHLAGRFGLGPVKLVNDFVAAARGAVAASPADLVTLQAGDPLPTAPRLVIGAGTGLGMALALHSGRSCAILPGEGGHIGFSPQDATGMTIHAALLAECGRVTAERVISGPGLSAIHRILHGLIAEPAAISDQALAGQPQARQTLEAFLAAYGGFAGDMALATLARGGVFLAGGIAARIVSLLPASPFLPAFNAKAEHAAIAARMPVFVVTDPLAGLRGAMYLAGAIP